MRFDHMCVMVADLDRALKLWCDVLGFRLLVRRISPDDIICTQEILDAVFRVKGARSEFALVVSDAGAMIELQQVQVPRMEKTPRSVLGSYAYTGIHELGLLVSDIDGWFEKVRAAGYETQTEFVWSVGEYGRTFLFFDDDGNLIQFREGPAFRP